MSTDGSNAGIAEYEILDAGGFKLLNGGKLRTDERFKLTVFSLIGSGPTTGPSTSSGSFIKGKKIINTATILDPTTDMNKIIQIRGGANSVPATIPDITDIPAESIIIFDTTINNTKFSPITTTGGQFIYFNNGSKNTVYMMPGEVLWLYRDTDGLYVINDFNQVYKEIGRPHAAYEIGLNQLLCKGQELVRSEHPRLWERVQALGASLVSEALWQTAAVYRQGDTYTTTVPPSGEYTIVNNPYKGCYSTGNGSTTFRLPNLMGVALRGVVAETGSDTERYYNKPGGFQENANKKFWSGTLPKPVILQVDGTNTETTTDNLGPDSPNIRVPVAIDKTVFKNEARMDNVGVLWVINE